MGTALQISKIYFIQEQCKLRKLEESRIQKERTREAENLKECTFTPKLNNYKLKEERPLLERNNQWYSKRETSQLLLKNRTQHYPSAGLEQRARTLHF
jgi:hypothetical protein